MKKRGGFSTMFFKTVVPKIYSLGAAVVIFGAMFKILHLPGASEMLGIGLTTEAIIFILSAMEPTNLSREWNWSKVYPELLEDRPTVLRRPGPGRGEGVSQKLDRTLEQGKIGPELIDRLGKGLRSLADNAGKLGQISNASVATSKYTEEVTRAAHSMNKMNESYGSTIGALAKISQASADAGEYQTQVQSATKNLGALNSVYQSELKSLDTHLKAVSSFYSNLTSAMESISMAGKHSENFRDELGKLTTHVADLNKVYGSMLSAMRSGGGIGVPPSSSGS
ncbi:MAG: gliding motility protein GldL [Cytophagales bacterium]|nr:gliding motility protein GldL [Cytophagales bacterium]